MPDTKVFSSKTIARDLTAGLVVFLVALPLCLAGMIGGIPVTSVVVRSSVSINSGGQTKLATLVHGLLLLSVSFLPSLLNRIPLSCLAAILLMTGLKLASPALVRRMWSDGRYQFVPFVVTVVSIVLTDLMIGVGMGLAISLAFSRRKVQ